MTDTEYKGGPLPEPTTHLRFRAAQSLSPDGWCEGHEWLEECRADEIGDDRLPASAVYTASQMRAYAAQEVAAERERCAAAAWNHYMDTCHRLGRAPSMWHEWCASNAIRRTAP